MSDPDVRHTISESADKVQLEIRSRDKPQTIGERPVKATGSNGDDPRVRVDMSLKTAYGVLASPDIPEEHRKRVFEAVVDL